MISDATIESMVRERIAAALPAHVARGIARQILRKQLGTLTLDEAARWLRWNSPVALGRALKRFGVDKIKTSSRIVTFAIPDLVRFREAHRVSRGKRGSRNIIKMEGNRAA